VLNSFAGFILMDQEGGGGCRVIGSLILTFSQSGMQTWHGPTLRVILHSFTGSVLSVQLEKLNNFVQVATSLL